MKKYEDLSTEERLACISLFPDEARKDKNWAIRREAYRILGYTEGAKKDKNWIIRRQAYRILGYTEEAKKDEDCTIRREAEIYISIINS